ncbi:ABC transporter ATP-binding protein [Naasia lichenicola]|uniref:Spermidine/putrescine import ATP-binding protein PotA n=1 Tax=Naasia lichenicola TaxID=2565933 RepID=A0A4S4FS54_9MICO|nr:ABC transporter ATP-binding protein [Naasia lichenicola]THG33118.1 ABC transporter ATP-binding protein [Naasia lichenicola]
MTSTAETEIDFKTVEHSTAPGRVTLSGVSKLYGKNYAVQSLDLDIRAGEFISLLGPSGCGKTTTLRMIGGFEYPDEGSISISDVVMQDLPPHKRPVNTVFQAYALFPHMSVAKNVAYGLGYAKVPKSEMGQRVGDALAMVRMKHLADRMPAQLSGGQQQRIALARALVNRPSVLLLDEPMSALDRKLREEMQIELKLLQQQLGTTFVFVTHDQEEAMTMSDRIAVMNGGRIEQIGSPAEVYDSPTTANVAGFIGQQNFFTGSVENTGPVGASVTVPGATLVSAKAPGQPLVKGGPATVAVRPENVTVTAGDAAGPNQISATLMSISQLGSYLQVVMLTAEGLKVMARTNRTVDMPTRIGDAVTASWSAESVTIYPTA